MARLIGFAVFSIAALARAQTPNYLPALWEFVESGSVALGVPRLYGSGLGSCQEAGDAAWALIQDHYASEGPYLESSDCPATSTSHRWYFRLATDAPTTSSRGIQISAYCEANTLAWYYAAYGGIACSSGNPTRPKHPCPPCVGNPVSPGFGIKLEQETDYAGHGPFPLRFERLYNSFTNGPARAAAGLGAKWSHSYHRQLSFTGPAGAPQLAGALRPDGRSYGFTVSGGTASGDPDANLRLERLASGWQLTNADDERELYDDSGRLLSITNRQGLVHSLTYQGRNLARIEDPFGRALTLEHDRFARIVALTAPDGARTTYAYSADNFSNLVAVGFPDGGQRTYHYEDTTYRTQLTGISARVVAGGPAVRLATYGYSGGLVVSSEQAGGANRVTVSYPSYQTTSEVTTWSSASQSTTRTYRFQSIRGMVLNTAISGPPCAMCGPPIRAYDTNGNLASSTDWNGVQTTYSWDLTRNLETSRTEAAGTGQPRTTSTTWHASLRLPASVTRPGLTTTYAYDAGGNLIRRTESTTGASREWLYTYDAHGRLTSEDGPRTDVADVTSYAYHADDDPDLGRRGNLASVTNAAGHVTQYAAYDAAGRPTEIVDPNGVSTLLAYDARGRLTSVTSAGAVASFAYDAAGNRVTETSPNGAITGWVYDAAHRPIEMRDGVGNRALLTLDALGNVTEEERYDGADQLVATRTAAFASLFRPTAMFDALGRATLLTHDGNGNVTTIETPDGRSWTSAFDALGRPAAHRDPLSAAMSFAYDAAGHLTSVTDPRGLVTTSTVDGFGRTTATSSPDSGDATASYDDAGNILSSTDAVGRTTTRAYDALDRPTSVTFADGSRHLYAYDAGTYGLGRLASITELDAAGRVRRETVRGYDAAGRVVSEERTLYGQSYLTGYIYDAAGSLTELTYPSGRRVIFRYDAAGRLTAVATAASGGVEELLLSAVEHRPFGSIVGWTFADGTRVAHDYDLDGRIGAVRWGAVAHTLTYDASGDLIGIASPTDAWTYSRDGAGRITNATDGTRTFAYSYDPVGNRTSRSVNGATDTYAYGSADNRLVSIALAGGGSRAYGYDATGALVARGGDAFAYDARGRLETATVGGRTTTFAVDAEGRRVDKTVDGLTTVYHYDVFGRLIAETLSSGQLLAEYLYLDEVLVGVIR